PHVSASLSLHDALPISVLAGLDQVLSARPRAIRRRPRTLPTHPSGAGFYPWRWLNGHPQARSVPSAPEAAMPSILVPAPAAKPRSDEHTSELQSQSNLV